MIFDNCSVSEFLGIIIVYPYIFYIIFSLFTGFDDAVIFWFRKKTYRK
jgi:hypothetical protein